MNSATMTRHITSGFVCGLLLLAACDGPPNGRATSTEGSPLGPCHNCDDETSTTDANASTGSDDGAIPETSSSSTTHGEDTGAPAEDSSGTTTDEPEDTFCPDGLLGERLDQAPEGATISGGTFIPGVGWQTSSASDQITWDLGQTVRAGSLSFQVTGIHANVGGCQMGVCYYVGLFDDESGDKATAYDGAAFIESRFHTNGQENFHDVFKLQTGIGDGNILEPLTSTIGWAPDETHTIRIDWEPLGPTQGRAWLYIDGQEADLNYPAYYSDPETPWRYLMLGTTNYKGLAWGMVNATYSDLCLTVKS